MRPPSISCTRWEGPLHTGLLRSVELFPHCTALEIAGESWTYRQLFELSASLASTLDHEAPPEPPLTGIIADRSLTTYVGIMGTLLRGHGYVPFSPASPPARSKRLIVKTGLRTLIVESQYESTLMPLLADSEALVVVIPDRQDVDDLRMRFRAHKFLSARDLHHHRAWKSRSVSPEELAYILFTSGSTGEPKGVRISHRNVTYLVDNLVQRYGISSSDRICQMADVSFDPSVADIFTAWFTGASIHCLAHKTYVSRYTALSKYLIEQKISILHTVPSVGLFLQRLGALKPGRFPDLRVTLFGGEALPVHLARAWSIAAPNSIIENVYGPTECTVDATAYRWHSDTGPEDAEDGIVPIGYPLPGFTALVLDENLNPIPPGQKGELFLGGPQVSMGYVDDPELTRRAFVRPLGEHELFYRTGDQVRRPQDGKPLCFHGRIDHQVKIFGARIEIGDIEAPLRELCDGADVAVVGWPRTETGVAGFVAFVGSFNCHTDSLKTQLQQRLPPIMVPSQVRCLGKLPLNANGKVDRRALIGLLETELLKPAQPAADPRPPFLSTDSRTT